MPLRQVLTGFAFVIVGINFIEIPIFSYVAASSILVGLILICFGIIIPWPGTGIDKPSGLY
jgi:uncharacterized membrane protein HdeD (DUF308 family)